MVSKVRRWMRRTFLTGEGELRSPGALTLAVVLLALIALLELLGSAPVALYLVFVGSLGYVAGERQGSAKTPEVESVAPPYIPEG